MGMNKLTCALAALTLTATTALADDTIKLAVGQRGNWDTSVSEVGQLAGAGETQQAVISGSVDLGIAAGVMGVMSAYAKGAPVRVIGAETTGAGDL